MSGPEKVLEPISYEQISGMVTASLSESDGRARGKVKSDSEGRSPLPPVRRQRAVGEEAMWAQAEAPRKPARPPGSQTAPRGRPDPSPEDRRVPWADRQAVLGALPPAPCAHPLPRELPGLGPAWGGRHSQGPQDGGGVVPTRRPASWPWAPDSALWPRSPGDCPFLKNCPRTREQGAVAAAAFRRGTHTCTTPSPIPGKGSRSGRLVRTRSPSPATGSPGPPVSRSCDHRAGAGRSCFLPALPAHRPPSRGSEAAPCHWLPCGQTPTQHPRAPARPVGGP